LYITNPDFSPTQKVITNPVSDIILVAKGGDSASATASVVYPAIVVPPTYYDIKDLADSTGLKTAWNNKIDIDDLQDAADKDAIADIDEFNYLDSASAYGLVKTTWLNIKAKLKSYFDGIYSASNHNHNLNDLTEKSYTNLTGKPDLTSLHTHTNKEDLDNVSGSNTGDQASSDFDVKDLTDSTNLRSTWSGKQDALTFSTDIETDKGSTTKISAIKTFYDWATGKFINLAKIVTTWTATTLDTNIPSEKLVKNSLDLKTSTLEAQCVLNFDLPADRTVANVYAPVPFIKDIRIIGAVSTERYYISQLKKWTALQNKTAIDINKSNGTVVASFLALLTDNALQEVVVPQYCSSGINVHILLDNTGSVDNVNYASNTLFIKRNKYTTQGVGYLLQPTEKDFDGSFAIGNGLKKLVSGQAYGGSNGGSKNHYSGLNAGLETTIAMKNTGVGNNALKNATSGWANTAVGYNALSAGIGTGALTISGGGTEFYANVAIGESAMAATTTGSYNTAVGCNSMFKNTTGINNTCIGLHALNENTTGSYNTAVGGRAIMNNVAGVSNVGIGSNALTNIIQGSKNTIIGTFAASKDSTTANITALENCISIGYYSKPKESGDTNEIIIGYEAIGQGSNTTTIGNDNITDTYLKGKTHTTSSLQVGDDVAAASSANVGAIRYRADVNNSYCEMCMQTGASTYAWVIIKQNTW
jgi:hypothetical protein